MRPNNSRIAPVKRHVAADFRHVAADFRARKRCAAAGCGRCFLRLAGNRVESYQSCGFVEMNLIKSAPGAAGA